MVGKMAASQPYYQLIRNLWKVKMKCMFPPPVLWTCGSCTSSLSQLPAGRIDQLIKQKPTLWQSGSKLGNTTSRNHRGAVSITWYRLSFSYTLITKSYVKYESSQQYLRSMFRNLLLPMNQNLYELSDLNQENHCDDQKNHLCFPKTDIITMSIVCYW